MSAALHLAPSPAPDRTARVRAAGKAADAARALAESHLADVGEAKNAGDIGSARVHLEYAEDAVRRLRAALADLSPSDHA